MQNSFQETVHIIQVYSHEKDLSNKNVFSCLSNTSISSCILEQLHPMSCIIFEDVSGKNAESVYKHVAFDYADQ